jgi:hypothetical protein
MMLPFRILAGFLAFLGAGCVWPGESMRLATRGPEIRGGLQSPTRPAAAGDRVVLVLQPRLADGERIRACVEAGLRRRLPAGIEVVGTTAERAAPWLGRTPDSAAAPPAWPGPAEEAWLVAIEDRSSVTSGFERVAEAEGTGGGFAFGVGGGHVARHHLEIEGRVWDLRGRVPLGTVVARFDTRGGGYVIGGLVGGAGGGGAIILPYLLPVVVLPAGTSASAICAAFGEALGTALNDAWRRAAAAPS